MKKILLTASLLMIVSVGFAQKQELKQISKSISKGEYSAALSNLDNVKDIALADPKYAPEYYFLSAKLYAEKAKNNQDPVGSISLAIENLEALKKLNAKHKKDEVQEITEELSKMAAKQGQDAYAAKNYKKSAEAFENYYNLVPTDTVFLYNSALLYTQAKEYDKALQSYEKLKNLGYTGVVINYFAKNKETGKEESFQTKNQRDLMVKSGKYFAPRQAKEASKKAEIVKSMALIHMEKGNKDKAIKAFEDARKVSPKDASLAINEAYIYYQMDDKDKFKQLMQEAAELEPENADVQYNIGVVNLQQKETQAARKSFEKALELNPAYSAAALNLSTTYINEGNDLVAQMNQLGNTKADLKKYDEFRDQKDQLFKKAAQILEDFTAKQGNQAEVLNQLQNIYRALGDSQNYKRVKSIVEGLQ